MPDNLYTAPWKKVAATARKIQRARILSNVEAGAEIGVGEVQWCRWIGQKHPVTPRREGWIKIVQWCEKHQPAETK